jgi:hypothetical protein
MSKRLTVMFVLCLTTTIFLAGCTGTNPPKDFPKTLPFKITVLKAGKPVESVNIRLMTTAGGNWTVSGNTNSSGIAVMQTVSGSYSKKGVPEGSYKVILHKPIAVDPALLGPEPKDRFEQLAYEKKAKEIQSKMTPEVPLTYNDGKTTPVTIEVTKGKSSETIDIGKQ